MDKRIMIVEFKNEQELKDKLKGVVLGLEQSKEHTNKIQELMDMKSGDSHTVIEGLDAEGIDLLRKMNLIESKEVFKIYQDGCKLKSIDGVNANRFGINLNKLLIGIFRTRRRVNGIRKYMYDSTNVDFDKVEEDIYKEQRMG